MPSIFRRLIISSERRLSLALRRFDSKWPLIWRFIFCYLLASLFLASDQTGHFDSRLKLRTSKSLAEEVATIVLRPFEMQLLLGVTGDGMSFQEPLILTDVSDSFFWDKRLWFELLEEILSHEPRKIGVTLYFPPSLSPSSLTREEQALFFDERIVWGSLAHQTENYLGSMFGKADRSNQGFIDLIRDEDGTLRRVPARNIQDQQNIVEVMLGRQINPNQYINFQSDPHAVNSISAREILNNSIPPKYFKNKWVIIGSDHGGSSWYLTPKGNSHRPLIWSEILNSELQDLWIQFLPFYFYLAYLCAIGLISLWIVTHYPQSVSVFFLVWFSAALASLSIWVFDEFSIWIPMASAVFMIWVSWIVFGFYRTALAEQRAALLTQERANLVQFEELKNNFMSLISHDLKTPIAKIKAVSDRLQMKITQANLGASTAEEDLRSLHLYTDELTRYIQTMLTLLRAETKHFRPRFEAIDINSLIENAIERIEPLAKLKAISINKELEPLFLIEADPTLLTEVILNLIDNAIKYSHQNTAITVSSYEKNDKIWVEVQDQGSGIPKNELSTVFEKFRRGTKNSAEAKGTGLGLYLVKYFIELHGGEVYLDSELGKGTLVRFFLPLETNHLEEAIENKIE